MEELRWREIKKTFGQCKEARHAGEFSDHNGNMEMYTNLKATRPHSPQCAAALFCLFPEFYLWEESRWNPPEANQAAGENGAHGPLSKKAMNVFSVWSSPLWMINEDLFLFRQSPGIAGRTTMPTVYNAEIKPPKALCVRGKHSTSWTTPLAF